MATIRKDGEKWAEVINGELYLSLFNDLSEFRFYNLNGQSSSRFMSHIYKPSMN